MDKRHLAISDAQLVELFVRERHRTHRQSRNAGASALRELCGLMAVFGLTIAAFGHALAG